MERRDSAAGLAEEFLSNWTSDIFRERCVAHIESVRSVVNPKENSDDPMEKFLAQKSSKELEDFIFKQSTCREDYMSLSAEMLMMLRQYGKKPLVNMDLFDDASPEVLAAAGMNPDEIDMMKDRKSHGGQ